MDRLTTRLLPEDPAQVYRLQVFRAARPDVIIGPLGFEAWQARIPEPNGETVTSRDTLKELLDRLDQLTSGMDLPRAARHHIPPWCRAFNGLPTRFWARIDNPAVPYVLRAEVVVTVGTPGIRQLVVH
jgi:hypothetical protein